MRAKKHMKDWTPAEVRRLRALSKKKIIGGRTMSSKMAAAVLGRSPGAVRYKAMMEGIRFTNTPQPRGVQKRIARRRRRS